MPELVEFFGKIKEGDWKKDKLEAKTAEWIKEKGFSVGSVLWPMRTAISGQENSPGPFEIAEVLGKEAVLERINLAVNKLSN